MVGRTGTLGAFLVLPANSRMRPFIPEDQLLAVSQFNTICSPTSRAGSLLASVSQHCSAGLSPAPLSTVPDLWSRPDLLIDTLTSNMSPFLVLSTVN